MSFITIICKTITEFNELNDTLIKLKTAINTPLIPTGETLDELIQNFIKINFSRRFNDGYDEAIINLSISNHTVNFQYESTSQTKVIVDIDMTDSQQFRKAKVEVLMPDDRVQAGRIGYESITKQFFGDAFSMKNFIEAVFKTDKFYSESFMILKDSEVKRLPTPRWVLDEISNANFDPDRASKFFLRFGFVPREGYFFKNIWVNDSTQQIIVQKQGLRRENVFALMYLPVNRIPESFISFRRVCELLHFRRLCELLRLQTEQNMRTLTDGHNYTVEEEFNED